MVETTKTTESSEVTGVNINTVATNTEAAQVEVTKVVEPSKDVTEAAKETIDEKSVIKDSDNKQTTKEIEIEESKKSKEAEKSTNVVEDGNVEFISINETGDYVDKDGNVIIKKDDAKFDDEGNLVLPKEVVKDSVIDVLKTQLEQNAGYEFKDENGQPIVYEDTEIGATKLVTDAIKQGVIAERNALYETYPQVKDFLNHLIAGRSPSDFFNPVNNLTDVKLPEDTAIEAGDNAIRRQIIEEDFKMGFGFYNTTDKNQKAEIAIRAKLLTDTLEHSGKLVEEAKPALDSIKRQEQKLEQERNTRNAAIIQAEQEENNKYWTGVSQAITNGDLKGLTIPKSERQSFLDYVSKDVTGKGETQEALDQQSSSIELGLQLAYMRFKKFNLDDLVNVRAGTKNAATLSSRKIKYQVVKKGSNNSSSSNNNLDVSSIKLSTLL